MNILMVGAGKGSWEMRGLQLGAALGARVVRDPSDSDLRWADMIVLIKRAILTQRVRAVQSGKPIVWDALDFWTQPFQNDLSQLSACAVLKSWQRDVTLTVGATAAMAQSAGNGFYLPHHGHAGLHPTDARPECRVVGYDGNPIYLDWWSPVLRDACARRGWSFVINPPDLSAVDILVSLRGGIWDGWMCREWKSGVKIVNAILAGRPILTQDCAAARELQPDGMVIETASDLNLAPDEWADVERRAATVERSQRVAPLFALPAIAQAYRLRLEALCAQGVLQ